MANERARNDAVKVDPQCLFALYFRLSLSRGLFEIIILTLNGGACRAALSASLLVFRTFREIVRREPRIARLPKKFIRTCDFFELNSTVSLSRLSIKRREKRKKM